MNLRKTPLVVAVFSLLAIVACAQATGTGPDRRDDAGATEKGEDAKFAQVSEPCTKLAEKLCEELGKESPSCEAAKQTLDLVSDRVCRTGLADFAVSKTKVASQAKRCDELVEKLCAGVGPETASCAVVKEKTREFPPAQCVEMLAHLDEVIKELKDQERASKPLDSATQQKLAANDAPSFGPANAKVTLVSFSDFECPYCSKAAGVVSQVREKYGDKVRFVFRQFPLSFHKNAPLAAQASLAAHAQGKFWEMHDKMFANQQNLDRDSLDGYAKAIGLDMARFTAALDAQTLDARVRADAVLGNEVAVQGTPTLFINGVRVSNPTDFAEVGSAIELALGG